MSRQFEGSQNFGGGDQGPFAQAAGQPSAPLEIPLVNELPQRQSNPSTYQQEGRRIIMEKGHGQL